MKFSFHQYFKRQLKFLLILLFIFVIFVWLCGGITLPDFLFFIGIIIVDVVYDYIHLRNTLRKYSPTELKQMEQELGEAIWIHDEWYFTENYIFSMQEFQKIYYKDILVVEGSPTTYGMSGGGSRGIGWKQKLYLSDGTNCNIKFSWESDKELKKFKEILLEKNNDIFFGIIEDYKKKNEI